MENFSVKLDREGKGISKLKKYCPNCGLEIDLGVKVCPRCGLEQPIIEIKEKRYLKLWYLLPLFLGLIGGILGYLIVKDDDKRMATKLLVTGIIMTIAIPIIAFSAFFILLINILHGVVARNLPVNVEASSFTLTDINGVTFSLEDFRGKIVILDFFATWCGPCKTQMPHLSQVYKTYSSDKVIIISISVDPNSDNIEKLKQYASENHVNWIMARDTTGVYKKYGVSAIPTLFIIDKYGVIRYAHQGVTYSNVISSEIDSLLGQ